MKYPAKSYWDCVCVCVCVCVCEGSHLDLSQSRISQSLLRLNNTWRDTSSISLIESLVDQASFKVFLWLSMRHLSKFFWDFLDRLVRAVDFERYSLDLWGPSQTTRLIVPSLLRGQTLRGLTPQKMPANNLATLEECRKDDRGQLCSVRRCGHRAARCQMADVWCQMSNVRCQMADVRCLMSDVRCQMSNVWCLIADVRCLMSDVRCQMSDVW